MENKSKFRALVCCLADPSKNPRPNRIIKLLNELNFTVDILSHKISLDLKVNKEHIIPNSPSSITSKIYRGFLKLFRKFSPSLTAKVKITEKLARISNFRKIEFKVYDLIVVENLEFLPMIMNLKDKNSIIICDLREYYPLEFENSFIFRFFESDFREIICKNFLPKCDLIMTVSNGLSDAYERNFGIRPLVLYSTPFYHNLSPNTVCEKEIKCVHHGVANRDRKLENMIYMFKYLDNRFHLDFYLVGNKNYINELTRKSEPFKERIRFLDPIPFNQIITTLNNYDIGLYLLEDTNFNTRFSLPNKFFEFIQARLMVAVGPSPEMSKIVKQYELGVVSENFRPHSLAKKLNSLNADTILKFKQNSSVAAKIFCYENEATKIKSKIEEIFHRKSKNYYFLKM